MKRYIAKNCLLIIFFFLSVAVINPSKVYSLKTYTHQELNSYIAITKLSDFNLNAYTMNTLRLSGGVGHKFLQIDDDDRYLYDWLVNGGEKEDEPFDHFLLRSLKITEGARWMNHFHDPIHDSGLWWEIPPSNGHSSRNSHRVALLKIFFITM